MSFLLLIYYHHLDIKKYAFFDKEIYCEYINFEIVLFIKKNFYFNN